MTDSAVPSTADVLVFELDGHRFGLLATDVQEVLRAVTVSPLPRAPDAILGVFNLRGAVVPVFDIRRRFGLRRRPLRASDALIVVNEGGHVAAIVAELVTALVTLPTGNIAPSRLRTGEAKHVAGVATLEDGNIIIYELGHFLTDTERSELGDALASASGPVS